MTAKSENLWADAYTLCQSRDCEQCGDGVLEPIHAAPAAGLVFCFCTKCATCYVVEETPVDGNGRLFRPAGLAWDSYLHGSYGDSLRDTQREIIEEARNRAARRAAATVRIAGEGLPFYEGPTRRDRARRFARQFGYELTVFAACLVVCGALVAVVKLLGAAVAWMGGLLS